MACILVVLAVLKNLKGTTGSRMTHCWTLTGRRSANALQSLVD